MELPHCTPFSPSPKLRSFSLSNLITTLNPTLITSISNGSFPILKTVAFTARDTRFTTTSNPQIDAAVVIDRKTSKPVRFEVFPGNPTPFGATRVEEGVNFAIFSGNSVSASLCLITLSDLHQNRITEEIALDPLINKTGDIWHVFLGGNFDNMLYGYKFDGPFAPEDGHYYDPSRILLDPFAKAVISRGDYGELGPEGSCWPQMACMIPSSDDEFDWQGDLPLKYRQRDLIIYEMHVRGFTKHDTSMTKYPGTYLGVIEKLDHLKELGINCIELMPCQEFNELEYYSYNAALGDYKYYFLYPVEEICCLKIVLGGYVDDLLIYSIYLIKFRLVVMAMQY